MNTSLDPSSGDDFAVRLADHLHGRADALDLDARSVAGVESRARTIRTRRRGGAVAASVVGVAALVGGALAIGSTDGEREGVEVAGPPAVVGTFTPTITTIEPTGVGGGVYQLVSADDGWYTLDTIDPTRSARFDGDRQLLRSDDLRAFAPAALEIETGDLLDRVVGRDDTVVVSGQNGSDGGFLYVGTDVGGWRRVTAPVGASFVEPSVLVDGTVVAIEYPQEVVDVATTDAQTALDEALTELDLGQDGYGWSHDGTGDVLGITVEITRGDEVLATPTFRELGLSQEQVQALLDPGSPQRVSDVAIHVLDGDAWTTLDLPETLADEAGDVSAIPAGDAVVVGAFDGSSFWLRDPAVGWEPVPATLAGADGMITQLSVGHHGAFAVRSGAGTSLWRADAVDGVWTQVDLGDAAVSGGSLLVTDEVVAFLGFDFGDFGTGHDVAQGSVESMTEESSAPAMTIVEQSLVDAVVSRGEYDLVFRADGTASVRDSSSGEDLRTYASDAVENGEDGVTLDDETATFTLDDGTTITIAIAEARGAFLAANPELAAAAQSAGAAFEDSTASVSSGGGEIQFPDVTLFWSADGRSFRSAHLGEPVSFLVGGEGSSVVGLGVTDESPTIHRISA